MMKKLQIKKHALTAISYMLPLVVASGLLIAIGNLTNGQVIENYKAPYPFLMLLSLSVCLVWDCLHQLLQGRLPIR